jgi:hypothetical protein
MSMGQIIKMWTKKKIFQKPTCGLEISIGQTKFYWPWAIVPPLTSNTENVNVDVIPRKTKGACFIYLDQKNEILAK